MIVHAAKNARRYARRLAGEEGFAISRFHLVEGSDDQESKLGIEWVAFATRGDGIAKVWMPLGDANCNEAMRNCTTCRHFGGRMFGITVRSR